jgi:hypothetical protein
MFLVSPVLHVDADFCYPEVGLLAWTEVMSLDRTRVVDDVQPPSFCQEWVTEGLGVGHQPPKDRSE